MTRITPAQGGPSRPAGTGTSLAALMRLAEDLLQKAECRFGERDRRYRIAEIRFYEGNPDLFYPDSSGDIIIRLCRKRESDLTELHYELAHECVHLLDPSGKVKATVLEEGLAVCFAEDHVREERGVADYHPMGEGYVEARNLARRLLAIDPGIVRALRQERQRALHLVTAADLCACNPSVPRELADRLAAQFYG